LQLLKIPGCIACAGHAIFENGAGIGGLIIGIIDIDQNLANDIGGGMTQTTENKHAHGGDATNADTVLNHTLAFTSSVFH
jgi:hypothetical protein